MSGWEPFGSEDGMGRRNVKLKWEMMGLENKALKASQVSPQRRLEGGSWPSLCQCPILISIYSFLSARWWLPGSPSEECDSRETWKRIPTEWRSSPTPGAIFSLPLHPCSQQTAPSQYLLSPTSLSFVGSLFWLHSRPCLNTSSLRQNTTESKEPSGGERGQSSFPLQTVLHLHSNSPHLPGWGGTGGSPTWRSMRGLSASGGGCDGWGSLRARATQSATPPALSGSSLRTDASPSRSFFSLFLPTWNCRSWWGLSTKDEFRGCKWARGCLRSWALQWKNWCVWDSLWCFRKKSSLTSFKSSNVLECKYSLGMFLFHSFSFCSHSTRDSIIDLDRKATTLHLSPPPNEQIALIVYTQDDHGIMKGIGVEISPGVLFFWSLIRCDVVPQKPTCFYLLLPSAGPTHLRGCVSILLAPWPSLRSHLRAKLFVQRNTNWLWIY